MSYYTGVYFYLHASLSRLACLRSLPRLAVQLIVPFSAVSNYSSHSQKKSRAVVVDVDNDNLKPLKSQPDSEPNSNGVVPPVSHPQSKQNWQNHDDEHDSGGGGVLRRRDVNESESEFATRPVKPTSKSQLQEFDNIVVTALYVHPIKVRPFLFSPVLTVQVLKS